MCHWVSRVSLPTSHTLALHTASRNTRDDATRETLSVSDVLHPESKQQTTPAAPRDALECVAALALTREGRQNCVRFAYRGPQVDRFHVLELKRDVDVTFASS